MNKEHLLMILRGSDFRKKYAYWHHFYELPLML